MDNELLRVLQLINDLSDQLAHNQKLAHGLGSQAGVIQDQAGHAGCGFSLRRYNTDITKETFESEVERLNAQLIIENQSLLQENKQLSLLLKEYENTMETIMAKFRNHALAAQQHELRLTRHYESLLLARDTQSLSGDLATSTNVSQSLQRLAHYLRGLLRTMAGETDDDDTLNIDPDYDGSGLGVVNVDELKQLVEALDANESAGTIGRQDWALEREVEIGRLEKENEELRRLLEIDEGSMSDKGVSLDLERRDSGRYSTYLSRRGTLQNDGTGSFGSKQAFWESNAPLQRALELQAGVRGGRRTSMFGAGQRGLPMAGRGSGIGGSGPLSLWNNQTASPAPPVVERGWQAPGGSNLDLNR